MLLLKYRPSYNQQIGQGTLNNIIYYHNHLLSLFARSTQLGYMKSVLFIAEQDTVY